MKANLSSPAGKEMSSATAGKAGSLTSTPTGGFVARKPSTPKSTTPILVRLAKKGK